MHVLSNLQDSNLVFQIFACRLDIIWVYSYTCRGANTLLKIYTRWPDPDTIGLFANLRSSYLPMTILNPFFLPKSSMTHSGVLSLAFISCGGLHYVHWGQSNNNLFQWFGCLRKVVNLSKRSGKTLPHHSVVMINRNRSIVGDIHFHRITWCKQEYILQMKSIETPS